MITTDSKSEKNLTSFTKIIDYIPLPAINTGSYGLQTVNISLARRSVNDIVIRVQPNDYNEADSCAIHGHCTTYKAAEILAILNRNDTSASYHYLHDFNITLPTDGNLLFQPRGIMKVEHFRNVSLGAMNLFNSMQKGSSLMMSQRYWNLMNSQIVINTEAFKNDLMRGGDVVLDGQNTRSKGVQLSFQFGLYSQQTDNVAQSTSDVNAYQTLGNLQMSALYISDAWNVISIQQNAMMIEQDIEKYK